jgi:release factor glutamine methyltransferase
VGELLRSASQRLREAGSESARLDAELLLGHVLGAGRATLLAAPEAPVSGPQQVSFQSLIERRASGEPVSYIRGLKEFYGLVLGVDGRALIPRPETEQLVDLALARLARMLTDAPRPAGEPLLVWDVGTGSGAISVALAVECRRRGYAADVALRATDISADALALATENAVVHGVADVIAFATADLADLAGARPADLLVANLPYVPSDVVARLPVAASYEPPLALDGGPDGLVILRRLIGWLPAAVTDAGVALLEIGAEQAEAVGAAVASALPDWRLTVHDDLAARPRVAELARGANP